MTDHSTKQLALFMNARDVRDYGTAAWDNLDLAGQEAYLTDAAAFVSAIKAIGWTPPGDTEAVARVLDLVAEHVHSKDHRTDLGDDPHSTGWRHALNDVEHELRMRAHALRNPEGEGE